MRTLTRDRGKQAPALMKEKEMVTEKEVEQGTIQFLNNCVNNVCSYRQKFGSLK